MWLLLFLKVSDRLESLAGWERSSPHVPVHRVDFPSFPQTLRCQSRTFGSNVSSGDGKEARGPTFDPLTHALLLGSDVPQRIQNNTSQSPQGVDGECVCVCVFFISCMSDSRNVDFLQALQLGTVWLMAGFLRDGSLCFIPPEVFRWVMRPRSLSILFVLSGVLVIALWQMKGWRHAVDVCFERGRRWVTAASNVLRPSLRLLMELLTELYSSS